MIRTCVLRTSRRLGGGRSILTAVFCLLASVSCLLSSQTRVWTESDYLDFEKGNLKNLSLRSDGLITLAPEFKEIYDTSSAYLWALARDSKGDLYAGGGPGAKLYRLSANGEKKTVAEFDGLQIQALAMTRRTVCMPQRRRMARSTGSRPTASTKCFTIRKQNTSGPWRSIKRATCWWPPATPARLIASARTATAA